VPKPLSLPFDPIARADELWTRHWGGVPSMGAITSIMRAQQILLGELDALLRPYGLTFARYEALVLLTFSRRGALPLGVIGERLMVHPTSVTNIISRLERQQMVVRRPNPSDGRGRLAEITDAGRDVVERATRDLMAAEFGLGGYEPGQLKEIWIDAPHIVEDRIEFSLRVEPQTTLYHRTTFFLRFPHPIEPASFPDRLLWVMALL